ncbi:hypothetical protein WA026_004753 [Henosepilachna vigintioctopunctata]|uniref:Uncharacterized protein n=1 Tax=Henosepilachna vigintioctopunctata TaxID=420089 RepID=A0AAW1V318_9CUCU
MHREYSCKKKWIHIGRIAGSNVTEEHISDYLAPVYQGTQFDVEKLQSPGQNSVFSVVEEKQANRLDHMPPNKFCFVHQNVESIRTSYRCDPIGHKETFSFDNYLK